MMKSKCHAVLALISFTLFIVGFLVINGWIFDISFLRSIYSGWVPMKFVTALCFMMSGLILFSITRIIRSDFEIPLIILSAASLVTVLFSAIFFASKIFQIPVSIEELFIGEIIGRSTSLEPCTVSMFNFAVIALIGIIGMFKPKNFKIIIVTAGVVVGFLGFFPIIGRIFNIPFLYYDIPGISVTMSVFSSPLFVLTGIGLILTQYCGLKDSDNKNENTK